MDASTSLSDIGSAGFWFGVAGFILSAVLVVALLVYRLRYRAAIRERMNTAELIENLHEGIYRSSLEGRQLAANRSLVRLNGYGSEAEMLAAVDDIEVLENPHRSADRASLLERMQILDEKRSYLQSMGFDTSYNLCRNMIESYPLMGILGTILAIGVVLQGGPESEPTVGALVTRFGEAIWSTFAGLVAAVGLMFLNSLLETPFTRLSESRLNVRDTVLRAKRVLSLPDGAGGTP